MGNGREGIYLSTPRAYLQQQRLQLQPLLL